MNSSAIEKKIKAAMEQQGTYSEAMDFSISLAAGAYMAYLKARSDVQKLKGCAVERKSREGHPYKIPHPEFKIMYDMAETARKAFRELCLTRATIEGGSDEDDVDQLINDVNAEDAGEE